MKYGMRERITGGIILVALAVILVPMFFGSPSERANKHAPTVTVNQTPIESSAPKDIVPPAQPQGLQPQTASTPEQQAPNAQAGQGEQPAAPNASTAQPTPYTAAPAVTPEHNAPAAPQARDNAMGSMRNTQPVATTAKPTAPAPQVSSKPATVAHPVEQARPKAQPAQTAQPSRLASKDPIMAAAGQRNAAAPAKPAAVPATPAASAPAEGWSVQAGSFGNTDNAQRLVQRLSENGFKAYTLKRAGNTVVMVGPFTSSQAGEQARTELQQRASINGFVVRGGKG